MRIIAGRFRRRNLVASPGATTRPITDRVKERLFQLIEPFHEERILDMFAGTGTIGLEALSRGARNVVFIERDHKAFELLNENISRLDVEEETLCWRTDALKCSFRPKGRPELIPYDRIFCDPPYPLTSELRPGTSLFRAISRLAHPSVADSNVEMILRVPARQRITIPDVWNPTLILQMGGMSVYSLLRADGDYLDAGNDEQDDAKADIQQSDDENDLVQ